MPDCEHELVVYSGKPDREMSGDYNCFDCNAPINPYSVELSYERVDGKADKETGLVLTGSRPLFAKTRINPL